MAVAYRVLHKPHRVIQPNGTIVRFEVGDIVENLTAADLRAFPDRFALATSADVDAYHQRKDAEVVALTEGPLAMDAAQQAAYEADLEAQIAALQAQLATAKEQTALKAQLKDETVKEAQAQAQAQRVAARTQTGQFAPTAPHPAGATPGTATEPNAAGGQRTEAKK
jgi:hypothetical protein